MALKIHQEIKKINYGVEENPTDNMPLHNETKGEDIEEKKEDISVPTQSKTD